MQRRDAPLGPAPGPPYIGAMKKAPQIIEGTYQATDSGRPARQPIFNNWRNAVPLLGLIAIRAIWVLASRIH